MSRPYQPDCDYCPASGKRERDCERHICVHCYKNFDLCYFHKGNMVHAHGSTDGWVIGPICANCNGWNTSEQKYKKNCVCGDVHQDPISDKEFLKIRDELEKNRVKKKTKLNETDYDSNELKDVQKTAKKETNPFFIFQAINEENNKNVVNMPKTKTLRLMSWNIQDLGAGFKGKRSDEVLLAIAQIIDKISPDVCAVIEVLKKKHGVKNKIDAKKLRKNPWLKNKTVRVTRKKKKTAPKSTSATTATTSTVASDPGIDEMKKIMVQLNKISKTTWSLGLHPKTEYTGNGSETYAYIYKDNGNITLDTSTVMYVEKDSDDNAISFPDTNKRRPMQAVFTFKDGLGSIKGKKADKNSWKLPFIAFHAPAQHTGDNRDPVPVEAFENLSKIAIIDPTDSNTSKGNNFPEYVIGADLNINFNMVTDVYDSESTNMQEEAEYIQKPYTILEGFGVDKLPGMDIFPLKTTLKQTSAHFELDFYPDEDWIEEDDDTDFLSVVDDDLDALFEKYSALQLGQIKKQEYEKDEDTFIQKYYEISTDKSQALKDKEVASKELRELLDYLMRQMAGGGQGLPSSTDGYCYNSFDLLVLVQKYKNSNDDDPMPECILKHGQTFVFPLLAAVTPKAALEQFFFGRNPVSEYGGMFDPKDCDGMVFDTLKEAYEDIYEDVYGTDTVDARKLTPTMCLKIANKLSDHLPLVSDLVFE